MTRAACFPKSRMVGNRVGRLRGLLLAASLMCFWSSADANRMEVVQLQHRPAGEIQAGLAPLLEPGEAVNAADGKQLLINAGPQRLQQIRRIVKKLDIPLRNLRITVLHNSVSSADELNAAAGSPARGMRGMNADTRDLGGQRNEQRLQVAEGRAARIQSEQWRSGNKVSAYAGVYGVESGTTAQSAGAGFTIVPYLLADGDVRLDLAPWSARLSANGSVDLNDIQTSIRTKLGQWIELAGTGADRQTTATGPDGFNDRSGKQQWRTLVKVDLLD
ncbi:type II and III secretion system protein [Methylomonas sp. HYX-M1]|uniref:type II and III secretion system protein n=1 Tax=Methylomonas sp. HYX-M1 TaxID=3139307 RepID=UPI00345BD5D5